MIRAGAGGIGDTVDGAASRWAHTSFYERYGKRAFDLVVSLGACLVLSPVMAIVAAAIRLDDGGPALFRQARVGRNGVTFVIFKFRSMPIGTAHLASADARALRITRFGRFLRRTNLDELPQFLNILRGDMSLVGPRPPLLSQYDLITLRRESGAIACVPGLTGLAQIHGYDGMPVSEKAAHDAQYACSVSFRTDLAIIGKTFLYLRQPPPIV